MKHRYGWQGMPWQHDTEHIYKMFIPLTCRGGSWLCRLLLWFLPVPFIRTRWCVSPNFHLCSIYFHLFYGSISAHLLVVGHDTHVALLPSPGRTHEIRLCCKYLSNANVRNKVFLPKIAVFWWVRLEFIFCELLAQHSSMNEVAGLSPVHSLSKPRLKLNFCAIFSWLYLQQRIKKNIVSSCVNPAPEHAQPFLAGRTCISPRCCWTPKTSEIPVLSANNGTIWWWNSCQGTADQVLQSLNSLRRSKITENERK